MLAVGVLGFGALQTLKKEQVKTDNKRLAPLVQCAAAVLSDGRLDLEADGEVIPFRQISLAAQVAGRVVHKEPFCQAGQFVTKGTLLLTIDPRDFELEIRRIQELMKQTEVNIEELDVERRNTEQLVKLSETDLELQLRDLERYEQLRERQAASQSALDTARRGRIQAENSLQTLNNQIRLLDTRRGRFLSEKDRLAVELEQAMLNRKRCDIVAPMDGMITEDPIEQDDYVQRGATLVQIEDTNQVEVRFDLRFDQLRWIWESQGIRGPVTNLASRAGAGGLPPAEAIALGSNYQLPQLPIEISIDVDGMRFLWDATLSRYDGARLNTATRTVPCIAVVEKPNQGRWANSPAGMTTVITPIAATATPGLPGPPALLRGMFVTAKIEVPASQPLVQIPLPALRPGNKVWTVSDNKLSTVEVKVAQAHENHVDLFASMSNVKPGDQVIVSPLSLAVDGMQVRTASAAANGVTGEDAASTRDAASQANADASQEIER